MAKYTKINGKYVIGGKRYEKLEGTRAEVWHGTAYKTSGGLKKDDLMQNKAGRIVSAVKYKTAKKEMRLLKAGYGTKKGKFGYVKVSPKDKSKKRGKSMRGGNGTNYKLMPSDFDGAGVGTSGADLQIIAGQHGGKRRRGKKSMRGGSGMRPLSNMASVSGIVSDADANAVQFRAGNATS